MLNFDIFSPLITALKKELSDHTILESFSKLGEKIYFILSNIISLLIEQLYMWINMRLNRVFRRELADVFGDNPR